MSIRSRSRSHSPGSGPADDSAMPLFFNWRLSKECIGKPALDSGRNVLADGGQGHGLVVQVAGAVQIRRDLAIRVEADLLTAGWQDFQRGLELFLRALPQNQPAA